MFVQAIRIRLEQVPQHAESVAASFLLFASGVQKNLSVQLAMR